MLQYIPSLIIDDANNSLVAIPTLSEVRIALWCLDPHSAVGPDGFNGFLFCHCWDVVQTDVHKAIQEFFLGFDLPRATRSTLIALIPKSTSPQTFVRL